MINWLSKWFNKKSNKENSKQHFIRKDIDIPNNDRCLNSFWNVINISNRVEIIRKVYEHLSSAKTLYYKFFEVQGWDYFDSYTFYCKDLNSWCEFVHRNGMYAEFKVHRTGNRYDIDYKEHLQKCEGFWEYLKPLWDKHKEEYLQDNNL